MSTILPILIILAIIWLCVQFYSSKEHFVLTSSDSMLDDPSSNWVGIDDSGNLSSLQVPKGTIIMWYAPDTEKIPDGWSECKGQSSSIPDFRGRMPLGLNPTRNKAEGRSERNAVGVIGGVETVTLTMSQMAKHRHDYRLGASVGNATGDNNTTPRQWVVSYNLDEQRSTTAVGGGESHNNMPPYCVIRFLIKM
jgi:hypothetical protein